MPLGKFSQRRRERHMDNPVLWVVAGVVGVLLLIFLFRMPAAGKVRSQVRVAVEGFAGGSAASLG
jgi:hypothetical protein